jgi:cytochrome c6
MIACLGIFGVHGRLKAACLGIVVIAAACAQGTTQAAADTETVTSTYKTNCVICHAEDGSGTALGKRLHAKDLRTKEVQDKPSEELAQTIRAGKNNMPAFGNRLGEDQIQKLVDYVRHLTTESH